MSVSFARRVSIPTEVLVQELAGEAVLLHLKTEQYFGLDAMGARMWNALTATSSIQQAYDGLLADYEVDPEQLHRDLSDLIEQLVSHGLVDVRED